LIVEELSVGLCMRVSKGDGFNLLGLEDFHQCLVIAAVPLDNTNNLPDMVFPGCRIDALNPGADVSGEAGRFCIFNHFICLSVTDEDIIQVYRQIPGGKDDFNGDGRRNPHQPVQREVFHNGKGGKQMIVEFKIHDKNYKVKFLYTHSNEST
jgi:hypothetical protein